MDTHLFARVAVAGLCLALCLALAAGCDKGESKDSPGLIDQVISTVSPDVEYYKTVDEVMADPSAWIGKTLRVHGHVEAGSIAERIAGQRIERHFVVESRGARLTVEHTGPKPDTFRDLAEVVVKGKMVRAGDGYRLRANELMAKCPSKYEGQPGGARPSAGERNIF